ncbi:MAG: TAT-variant-translocated molybdopterin oxidoreductase [Ignavibacteria bacterium]|nr:TAT-variant-translocated molybdopterin oxidoreductase [Ignavibacteria bacterium]
MDKGADKEKNLKSDGQTYWRSFSELYNNKAFRDALNSEFSSEELNGLRKNSKSSLSRRRFLALLGASAAFAAAGCSNYRGKGQIVPYNKKPEEVTLGIPNYYASTCTGCSSSCGILVKTREGRPVKVDGNPDHPVNKGKICAKGQASIVNLYNPERLKEPMVNEGGRFIQSDWNNVNSKIKEALSSANSSGKQVALISHSVTSPTFKKIIEDFQKAYPVAKLYTYEVFNESARRSAWEKTYGRKSLPVLKLDEARVILSLESDFLGTDPNHIENTRLFTSGRDVMSGKEFNRLYVVEGAATLTGFNADYRIRLRTDAIEEFVLCLISELVVKRKISPFAGDSQVLSMLSGYKLDEFAAKHKLDQKVLNYLLEDLLKNQGSGAVIAGDMLPESTHIAVNFLNEVLGNSKLYSRESESTDVHPLSTSDEIETLISSLNSGNVDVVIHLDSNPVYHFSPDYSYRELLKKVKVVITLTEMINESAELSNFIIPLNDPLESWGDYKTRSGFYSLQQPVIAPLYNTRQKETVLLEWTGRNYSENLYHDYLKENWEKSVYPMLGTTASFDKFWFASLHDGVAFIQEKPEASGLSFSKDAFLKSVPMKASDGYVLLLQNNNTVGDGRFASNGWLQELPHPISKVTWDNYAAVSPQAASELSVNSDDLVEISVNGRKQVFPVFVQPGLADKVIEVSLGYGRTAAGVVGTGVGVDAGVLVSAKPAISDRLYNNISVSKVSGKYELASTQEHYPIDSDPLLKDIHKRRGIIREGTWLQYKEDPKFLEKERHKMDLSPINKPPVYAREDYKGYKWGMAIDMNKCTGCGECIMACSIENNIPVVGKDQVIANREMMWLRIDRYYSGTPEAPKASFQPMLCQQCDYAPCENVCPVAATTHSEDGLNGMTYNRCVGTRYCSNNCPYKVRRFNYFDFRDHFKDSYQYSESFDLMANPEVTIRARGVMEKCTFCVQRIMKEREDAIRENREVIGSNVTTACQDACPSDAIVFGNVNDQDSQVAKYREHELGYTVLEEIKVAPNVTYIARLRNIFEKE